MCKCTASPAFTLAHALITQKKGVMRRVSLHGYAVTNSEHMQDDKKRRMKMQVFQRVGKNVWHNMLNIRH